MKKIIRKFYNKFFLKKSKEIPFIIFISFLFMFLTARIFVFFFPAINLYIKGYHIHHFYYGVILLLISSFISILTYEKKYHRTAAIFLGLGLGYIMDELGLMLTCGTAGIGCDYHARITYDTVIIISLIFLNIIYFQPFWKVVLKPLLTPRKTLRNLLKRLWKK